jgi:hypothetical protein
MMDSSNAKTVGLTEENSEEYVSFVSGGNTI